MGRLQKVISNSSNSYNGNNEVAKKNNIPQYNASGKVITQETKKKKKIIPIIGFIIVSVLAFIYVPAIVMSFHTKKSNAGYTVPVNVSAITLSNEELQKNPTEDFDGDGLDNSKEVLEGTNPWNIDTDFDGATDYYELYTSKTDPTTYDDDIIINIQKRHDDDEGKRLSSPYKMGNVILWADDYISKSHGGVIQTMTGYRFYKFKGYAQFSSDKMYLYAIKDGVREKLEYLENENAWRIDEVEEVEAYTEPLEEVIVFGLFSKRMYAKPNVFTKGLACILPNDGFIIAKKMTVKDVDPDIEHTITVSTITAPHFSSTDTKRFANNTNSLSNLQYVYEMIRNNKCIAVSLFNTTNGEYIGVIYGYTDSGDLLIADYNSLEHVGKIKVAEIGRKMLDGSENIVYDTFFSWNGLGFNSSIGDRISFFAISE